MTAERRVPVERLVPGDRVQAVRGGPIGTVVDANRRGWTLVSYPRRWHQDHDTLPYQHGLDTLTLLSSPSRHDIRHPGSASGCVRCWAETVESEPLPQFRALRAPVNVAPGDDVTVKLSVVNTTGRTLRVVGVDYGPVRLVEG